MYAVYMDYELDGKRSTVILGGSISMYRSGPSQFLRDMSGWEAMDRDGFLYWEVDEDDLPWGYKFQTYYVAPYEKNPHEKKAE